MQILWTYLLGDKRHEHELPRAAANGRSKLGGDSIMPIMDRAHWLRTGYWTESKGALFQGKGGEAYRLMLQRISVHALEDIRSILQSRISRGVVNTREWMPARWDDSPFHAIYNEAADGDHDVARIMLKMLIWEAFEQHPANWFPGNGDEGRAEENSRIFIRMPDPPATQ